MRSLRLVFVLILAAVAQSSGRVAEVAGEMPVTIAVFVDPGHRGKELPKKPGWEPKPENRSFEYDTLSDQYAKFLRQLHEHPWRRCLPEHHPQGSRSAADPRIPAGRQP